MVSILFFFLYSIPENIKSLIYLSPKTIYSHLEPPFNPDLLIEIISPKELKQHSIKLTIEHLVPQAWFHKNNYCANLQNHPFNLFLELNFINNLRGSYLLKSHNFSFFKKEKDFKKDITYFLTSKKVFAIFIRTFLYFKKFYKKCLKEEYLKHYSENYDKLLNEYTPASWVCEHIEIVTKGLEELDYDFYPQVFFNDCFHSKN